MTYVDTYRHRNCRDFKFQREIILAGFRFFVLKKIQIATGYAYLKMSSLYDLARGSGELLRPRTHMHTHAIIFVVIIFLFVLFFLRMPFTVLAPFFLHIHRVIDHCSQRHEERDKFRALWECRASPLAASSAESPPKYWRKALLLIYSVQRIRPDARQTRPSESCTSYTCRHSLWSQTYEGIRAGINGS